MRIISTSLGLLVCLGAVVTLGAVYHDQRDRPRLVMSGTIRAKFGNPACAILSSEGMARAGLDPAILNNGTLDEVERQAIEEGCALEAIVTAPNGMRLSDVFLTVLRSEVPSGEPRLFSVPSRTDARGVATWYFKPIPNTHFRFEVMSPNPVGQSVRSNSLELPLCTGDESARLVQPDLRADVGRGCQAR